MKHMIELFKKSKKDFLWTTACIAYLIAFALGAIWMISEDRWRILLYAAGVFLLIGLVELFIMPMLYGFDDPFKGPTEQISDEMMEVLKGIIDSMEDEEK